MKKSFLLFLIALSLFSCCSQKSKTYRVQLKLADSYWTNIYLIEADESPDFRIDCYSYDCGQTGLHYNLNCTSTRFERPGVIDYKIIP